MKLYFVITSLFILLFGFCASGYLANYIFKIESKWSRVLVTLILGLVISLLVAIFAVIAIWP